MTGLREMLQKARADLSTMPPMAVRDALKQGQVDLIVDVRELHEFARGHVPGAVHVPRGWLEIHADPDSPLANETLAADKTARIVAYCWQAPGARQLLSAKTLKDMGYSNVMVMEGGLKEWKEQGLPIEASSES
jgi:sulfur-carrier protein adenylyltransferase/sulfurtransferase